jgi:carbonic anhydrase
MRLFEAIIDANHQALTGDKTAGLHPGEFADSLPVIALTCIDPRLNTLMPEVLGRPEDQFIWLRNAGNIIFDPMSSMMRTLALACAVKGGKEIAIIGHTDCRVRQTSVSDLLDRFRALGIDRTRLPDNINEFFGLFASERQNVVRGVDFVRHSPLIGPKIPVHGLLVDIQTGKLEWIVNGYQTLDAVPVESPKGARQDTSPLAALPQFNLGEMKFPDFKIGETVQAIGQAAHSVTEATGAVTQAAVEVAQKAVERLRFDPTTIFRVQGDDQKIYGPVPGRELERWLEDSRVDAASLAQRVGDADWKPLAALAEKAGPPRIPLPRTIQSSPKQFGKPRRH